MEEGLKIKIGADVTELDKGVKKAEQSFSRLKSSSNQAGFALQNLGRIASDAPFGFIAIQNNLDPLIQSFGQLRANSASTGAALKTLAGALLGPAGLFLAFTAISSAITVAIQKYGSLGNAFKALTGGQITAAERATESIKKLVEASKSVSDIQFDAGGDAFAKTSQIEGLISVFGDLTKSTLERKRALEELGKINKAYFGDLSFEKTTLQDLTNKANEYTQAILNQAIIKQAQEEIGKLGFEFIKQKKAVSESRQALQNASGQYDDYIKNNQSASQRVIVLDKNITDLSGKQKENVKIFNSVNSKIQEYSALIREASSELVKLQSTDSRQSGKEKSNNLSGALLNMKKTALLSARGFVTELDQQIEKEFGPVSETIKEQLQKPFDTIDLIIANLNLVKFEEDQKKASKILLDIQTQATKTSAEIFKTLSSQLQFTKQLLTEGLAQPLGDIFFDLLDKGKASFQDFAKSVISSIKRIVAQLIASKIIELLASLTPAGAAMKAGNTVFSVLQGVFGTGGVAAPNFGGLGQNGFNLSGQVVFVQRGPDLVGVLNQGNSQIRRAG